MLLKKLSHLRRKAGAGLGVACLIGAVLTGIRRSVRKKDSTRQKKEIAKEQA